MNIKYIIYAGLALLLLTSKEAVSENASPQEKPWELSEHTLVGILEESHYTPREFADALGSPSLMAMAEDLLPKSSPWIKTLFKAQVHSLLPDLDARFAKESGLSFKRSWEIQSYTFTYISETVDGRKITMSGRVTFPNYKEGGRTHQVKTLTLHTHQAFLFPEWAPSQSLMFMPVKAMWDSVVIEPDLQKWGVNFTKEHDGGGSAFHMARQLADCTVAALEVMRQHGVTLAPKGYSNNWGSSQGAVPALYFAKWYDTEAPQWFKDAIRLRATFAGEGATEWSQFMEYNYQHPEMIDPDLVVLAGYFKAFTQEQLGGYKPEEFVNQWFTDTKLAIEGREYPFLDVVSYFTPRETGAYTKTMTSYSQVYAPDMIRADGEVDRNSPKVRAWLDCLHQYNSLEGWTPRHQIYIAHWKQDDMIPYYTAHNQYLTLSDQGKNRNVHMLSVPAFKMIPRKGMSPHLVIAFMVQVNMAFAGEDPSDMTRLYRPVR